MSLVKIDLSRFEVERDRDSKLRVDNFIKYDESYEWDDDFDVYF